MGHAVLSPSSAHRWIACPGSVALVATAGAPDTGSASADEGTAAHEMAERILLGADGILLIGQHAENGWRFTADMLEQVSKYVTLVRDLVASTNGVLYVEQRVPIDHLTDELGATGTADCVIDAGDELIVVDLKYGRGVQVEAEDNPQMVMYASGVLRRMREADEMIGLERPPFKRVRMIIAQPRLGHFPEWALPMATTADTRGFDFWESSIEAAARSCGDKNAPLLPGEKGCRWCPAKAACPALAAQVEEVTGALFDDLTAPEKPDDLTGAADLSRKMQLVGLVEDWCKAVRAETERRLLAGESVDGFKLVKGRQGPRKWADAAEAEAALKGMKLGVHEMYDLSLISPTTAEKRTAEYVGGDGETRKPAIGPRQWKKLEPLITRAEGGLSVAPASDKRPAVQVAAGDADFAPVDDLM